ncbi:helix-turn-helix transcriptional regulator [Brevundimonas sp. TWP3-1-2b1]
MSIRQQREFSILSHHMRHAVRVQEMLENQSALIVSGLLEQMETIGFVCFRDGRIGAMSPKAEQLLVDGDRLRLRHGALCPTHGGAAALGAAIQQTFNGLVSAPVVVRNAEGKRPLVIEVVPLPFERHMSALEDAVLVLVRDPGQAERKRLASATIMFGYTTTEAKVAAGLLAGRSPMTVAAELGVEIATVRSHIRRIYEKSGVSSQLELTSLLGSLR